MQEQWRSQPLYQGSPPNNKDTWNHMASRRRRVHVQGKFTRGKLSVNKTEFPNEDWHIIWSSWFHGTFYHSSDNHGTANVDRSTWMGRAMPRRGDPQVSRVVLWVGGIAKDHSSQMLTIWPKRSCALRDFAYVCRCIAKWIWRCCLFKTCRGNPFPKTLNAHYFPNETIWSYGLFDYEGRGIVMRVDRSRYD